MCNLFLHRLLKIKDVLKKKEQPNQNELSAQTGLPSCVEWQKLCARDSVRSNPRIPKRRLLNCDVLADLLGENVYFPATLVRRSLSTGHLFRL